MINSVVKAIQIMRLFSSAEPRLTLAQISERLDLPKSTAHNLLKTLLAHGFVEKAGTDHYALGNELIALSQAARVNVELRDRAAPLLRQLADVSRESVYLTVKDGDYGLYIYAVESSQRLLARTAIGERAHFHCTSVGKAMMAYLSEEEVDAIINRVGLPAFTQNTIVDPDDLKAELAETRARGYALDREEHEKNTYCVGAPILDARNKVLGGCSISGTDPTIIEKRLKELSARIMYTAQEISRRMGYVPAKPSKVTMEPINLL